MVDPDHLTDLLATERQYLVATQRRLHQWPELSGQEYATAELVATTCRSAGLAVTEHVGGAGVLAVLRGEKPGPTVLIRADMDALPVHEAPTNEPRSRRPGVMHACGHDGHTAIALAVARTLARNRRHLRGTARFCFQPAEETDQGAEAMIRDGALDGVDVAVGLHLAADLPTGTVALRAGPLMASSDRFEVTFVGPGGHGGRPAGTPNPVDAAAELVPRLHSLRQDPAVGSARIVTVCMLTAGDAFNVIPARTVVTGTLRAGTPEDRVWLLEHIHRTAVSTAATAGLDVELRTQGTCPVLVNDPAVTHTVEQALHRLADGPTVTTAEPTTGGDDMACYLQRVPGTYLLVGCRGPAGSGDHHTPEFQIDPESLLVGARALTAAVLALGTGHAGA